MYELANAASRKEAMLLYDSAGVRPITVAIAIEIDVWRLSEQLPNRRDRGAGGDAVCEVESRSHGVRFRARYQGDHCAQDDGYDR